MLNKKPRTLPQIAEPDDPPNNKGARRGPKRATESRIAQTQCKAESRLNLEDLLRAEEPDTLDEV